MSTAGSFSRDGSRLSSDPFLLARVAFRRIHYFYRVKDDVVEIMRIVSGKRDLDPIFEDAEF